MVFGTWRDLTSAMYLSSWGGGRAGVGAKGELRREEDGKGCLTVFGQTYIFTLFLTLFHVPHPFPRSPPA